MAGIASPIEYDTELDQYVGIALDGHEVYGLTRRDCYQKLRSVNDVIIEHREKNRCEECTRDCRTAFPACEVGGNDV
jgi:hypothetical protein